MNDVKKLCQICGIRIAERTCPLCGRGVCDKDFDAKAGICISCKRGRRVKG